MSEIQKGRIEFDDPTFRAIRPQMESDWQFRREELGLPDNAESRADFCTGFTFGYVRHRSELEAFVRSLNAYAFEAWYGRWHEGRFCIFDGEGEVVASGADALEAWQEFVKNENKE